YPNLSCSLTVLLSLLNSPHFSPTPLSSPLSLPFIFLSTVCPSLPSPPAEPPKENAEPLTPEQTNINTLHQILSGQATLKFFLEFLYSKNRTDLNILKKIKARDLFPLSSFSLLSFLSPQLISLIRAFFSRLLS